jgi:hypothetical protein
LIGDYSDMSIWLCCPIHDWPNKRIAEPPSDAEVATKCSRLAAILTMAAACVGQTFLSAGDGDFPVAGQPHGAGKPRGLAGWKACPTS